MKMSNYRIFSRNFGFTLAEVLITLIVIGIISAMTIPSLIQNKQDMECKTALKRVFAELSNGVTKMARDYGPISQYLGVGLTFKPVFMQYFDVIDDCFPPWDGCVRLAYPGLYKTYAGNWANLAFLDDGQFVLKNGMTVLINDEAGAGGLCRSIFISVDVNGHQKPPNVWGRDLFTFQIINDTLKPLGSPDSMSCPGDNYTDMNRYCSKSSADTHSGMTCGVYALSDKDY